MPAIEIAVYGTPAPQGSKRHVGRGIMVESSRLVKPWREAVKWAFMEHYGSSERPVLQGPVAVEMIFSLARPKSSKRSLPAVKPDLSKLVRSTEDALTEVGAWEDDARVVSLVTEKHYAGGPGGLPVPGAVIRARVVQPPLQPKSNRPVEVWLEPKANRPAEVCLEPQEGA